MSGKNSIAVSDPVTSRGQDASINNTISNIKEKTIRGGFVNIFSQAVKFLLRTGSMIVLARLLMPEEFGLIGMVTSVTGIFHLFKDAGLTTVTVQRAEITEAQISTMYWLNAAVGVSLAILSLAIAPLIASFFREPRLFWVAVALSSVFVSYGLTAQHQALLVRSMRYATIAVIEILSQTVGIVVGVAMALGGYRYWALVGMAVVEPAATTIGVFMASRWVPGRPRRGIGTRSMLHFGGTVTLGALFSYLAYNTEKVLLGCYWGAESLGLYGRAYQLMKMPTDQLNITIGRLTFNSLSRLQHDFKRFRNYFLKGYSLTLAPTVPLAIMCALFSNEMVYVLLGPRWNSAASIFRFLAPSVLAFPMINHFYWLLTSRGQVGRTLRMEMVMAPFMIASYLVGMPYGPTGVAVGFSAMMTFLVVPMIAWALRDTPITARDVFQAARGPFLSGIVAATITFAARFFFGHFLSPFPRLVIGGGAPARLLSLDALVRYGAERNVPGYSQGIEEAFPGRREGTGQGISAAIIQFATKGNIPNFICMFVAYHRPS